MVKPANSTNSNMKFHTVWMDRYKVLAVLLAMVAIYIFGFHKQLSVSFCHENAMQVARMRMQQRAQQNPDNVQFQQAAQAGLFANEDYAPVYRNCMLSKGYEAPVANTTTTAQ